MLPQPGNHTRQKVRGYSKYEFDPWSGEVTKHSVDIKNPPMFLTDLFRQHPSGSREGWERQQG